MDNRMFLAGYMEKSAEPFNFYNPEEDSLAWHTIKRMDPMHRTAEGTDGWGGVLTSPFRGMYHLGAMPFRALTAPSQWMAHRNRPGFDRMAGKYLGDWYENMPMERRMGLWGAGAGAGLGGLLGGALGKSEVASLGGAALGAAVGGIGAHMYTQSKMRNLPWHQRLMNWMGDKGRK